MHGLLRVRCHACRTSFVSAHQGRAAELREVPALELAERCPHCGTTGRYASIDYSRGRLVGLCRPIGADATA